MKSACICLVYWHSAPELLESLAGLPNLDRYIISHRPAHQMPDWLYRCVPPEHVFYEPNWGYDWGAYEQFLRRGIYRNYQTIFFAHDDITLLDSRIFAVCEDILASCSGNGVIGNSYNGPWRDWPRRAIHCYAHSRWKPPSWDYCHDTVRGSFLATSSTALQKIESFEVLWDRHRYIGVGAGNWSLRASSGKIHALLGKDHPEKVFSYLSDTYLSSPYLIEMVRGEAVNQRRAPSIGWSLRYKLLVAVTRQLMTWYMNTPSQETRLRLDRILFGMYQKL